MTASTGSLAIPESFRDEIIAHARDHAPRECCGILAGRDGAATRLYRLTNLEPGVTRYLIDDEELFRAYWEIENGGEDLVAVYHSHPATPAWPSPTDVANATWPEAVYLICSLEHADAPDLRGFRIVDEAISEVSLT